MYTMPVKVIKKILEQELDAKLTALVSYNNPAGMSNRELLCTLFFNLKHELSMIWEYGDLESFVSEYYRMSLQEWIDSL